jgi:hypothetical protein
MAGIPRLWHGTILPTMLNAREMGPRASCKYRNQRV